MTIRRIAFDLPLDLHYAGIDPQTADLGAVKDIFAAEARRQGYCAVFGDAALHAQVVAEDWADAQRLDDDHDPERDAWQSIHDAIGAFDLIF